MSQVAAATERTRVVQSALDAHHVAVFGASAVPGKWGYNVVEKLLDGGYRGELTLVNPKGGTAFGRPLVSAQAAAGANLAVVSTSAQAVPGVLTQCADLGIDVAIVQASGYAEVGNLELDSQLREAIRTTGVRVIGPNCMGFYAGPAALNAMTMPGLTPGTVSMVSQSGGVAQQVARRLGQLGSGFDILMTLGNKVDVTFTEILDVLRRRPTTHGVMLYLERLDEGEPFLDVLADLAATRPVVVVLAGRTTAGANAARSHTGSMISRWDRVAGLLADAGAHLVDRLGLATAMVAGAAHGPRREGREVYVLSDGGGHSVLLADALERAGFELTPPTGDVVDRLSSIVSTAISDRNPLDLQGQADREPGMVADVLDVVVRHGTFDGIVVGGMFGGYQLFFDPDLKDPEDEAGRRIAELAAASAAPIVLQTVFATESTGALQSLRSSPVSLGEWPDDAVGILSTRLRPTKAQIRPVEHVDDGPDNTLSELTQRVVESLAAAGLQNGLGPIVGRRNLPDEDDGRRWVLRLDGFAHKARLGAIEVDLPAGELPGAFERLTSLARRSGIVPRVRLAPFLPHDRELIVSFWRHPLEGSGVMIGAGGAAVEETADVAIGRLPHGSADVSRLLSQTRAGRALLLASPSIADEFAEVVVKLSHIFETDLAEFRELECNPIGIEPGVSILDALPTL